MPQIKYNPVTGGSTFGDASKFFEGASRSLNRATDQAGSAFDKFRTGEIDAKTQRTDDALSAVSSLRTSADFDAAAANLSTPEAVRQQYGDIDLNKFNAAMQAQQGAARQLDEDERQFQIGEQTRADKPILDKFKLSLKGMSLEEAQEVDPSGLTNLGLSDPNIAADLLTTSITNKQGKVDQANIRSDQALSRQDAKEVRTERKLKKEQSKQLGTLLNKYLTESPDGALDADKFISEAVNAGIPRNDAIAYTQEENRITGKTKLDLATAKEKQRLKIREEKKDDFARELKEKATIKSKAEANSLESLYKELEVFTDTDFIQADAADEAREKTIKALKKHTVAQVRAAVQAAIETSNFGFSSSVDFDAEAFDNVLSNINTSGLELE